MLTTFIYFPVKLGLLQLYPAYICYKAIKANDQQQFGSLLTFLVVSILYLAIEYFADIFFFWFPFYTEIKLILVLWLILPQTQGAALMYTRCIDPFLNEHEKEIDSLLIKIQHKVKNTIVLYGKQCLRTIKKTILQSIFHYREDEADAAAATAAEATSVSTTAVENDAPVIKETGSYIINPYNLFSTLISTTASRLQSSTSFATTDSNSANAADLSNSPPTIESDGSKHRADDKNINVATESASLGRTESHESLNSFVNVKGSQSPSALSSPDTPQQPKSSQQPQQQQSEGATNVGSSFQRAFLWDYLPSFGSKTTTRNEAEEDKKRK